MKYSKTPILFAIATATLLLYGCFLGPENEPCTGRLILENPIPDTTVAVGDTLFIDLANPPLFVSTEGSVSYAVSGFYGFANINSNLIDNPNDENKNTLLIINGLQVGDAGIELNAFSGCLENQTTTEISIKER